MASCIWKACRKWQRGAGNALEIRGVTVRFGGLIALNQVDITVPAGGVVAVIGPNGSGKSTLFNAITGLVHAEGSIKLDGAEILGLAPHEILDRGVARTFQNIRLFPNLTVLENVMIGQHSRLRTGAFAAIFRPPATNAEEAGALKWATRYYQPVRQQADAAQGSGGDRPVLRQSATGGGGARACLPPEDPVVGRTHGRHESGRDAGTG